MCLPLRGTLSARRAWSTAASTRALTYMAVGMAASQLLGGALADRIALRWLIVMVAVGIIAVSSGMLAAGVASLLIPSFAIYGVAQGLMSIIASTGWARFFGRALPRQDSRHFADGGDRRQ